MSDDDEDSFAAAGGREHELALMAEERDNFESNDDSVKLFVGQIPKHMTEAQVLAMFKEFAVVNEVNIIKDKATCASRGCCFIVCPTRWEADKAVGACHNKVTLPGASSPLQVKYANGELERLEHKLFVGMLPKNVSETEITALFSKFGNIKELQILRGSPETSKGCAFLKYEKKEEAIAALEAVNGKHKIEGSNSPLVVKWADTEKDRQARMAQKNFFPLSYAPNSNTVHPLFGALPVGYMSLYNGYGYQSSGSYGLMQYRLPPFPNRQDFHSMIPPLNRENGLQGNNTEIVPHNFESSSAGYLPSVYQTASDVRFPLSYPGGGSMRHGLSSISPNRIISMVGRHNPSTFLASSSSSSSNQVEGPPGSNLFVYQIPQDFGDQELENTFEPFGRILSTKVFLDKDTGISKCFGFVSYDAPAAAQSAIDVMNGFLLGGRKLKVQLKRENKQSNNPY